MTDAASQSTVSGTLNSYRSVDSNDPDTWPTFNFEWLFDPDRIDHLPIQEQLKHYAQRDLKKTKIYKHATKIWGAPLSRKRFIVAPSMYGDSQGEANSLIQRNTATSQLNPPKQVETGPSKEFIQEQLEKDKVNKYKKWMDERKTFRKDLDNMGLNIEYLDKKPDKTAIEKRVLKRMLDEKYPKRPPSPPREETPLIAILPEDVPMVHRPSPMAIQIIEKFLHENKLRLIDLFRSVDKDKDWKVSRDEFRTAILKAKIPISEVLLEDLILALDSDLNNELDYRELAKGMGLWKIEKRESKRKRMTNASFTANPTKYAQMCGFESPDFKSRSSGPSQPTSPMKELRSGSTQPSSPSKHPVSRGTQQSGSPLKESRIQHSSHKEVRSGKDTHSMTLPSTPGKDTGKGLGYSQITGSENATQEQTQSPTRIKSALSTISSTTSNLEAPRPDTRDESRVVDSEEAMLDLRKRDREALNRLTSKKGPNGAQKPIKRRETSNLEAKVILKTVSFTDDEKEGDKAIDNHLTPSTLAGETAEQVDRFRQLRYKEYNEICRLCKENSVPLSEGLLKKVLMFPPDKSHKELSKRIRQPAMKLHSQHFADPPKEPKDEVKTPTEEEKMAAKATKVKVAKDGKIEVYVDSRQAYPKRTKVAPVGHKMQLSSGKAVIRRQVDCWLTFEEYERLTRHLATRYVNIHGHTDDNAFWPGHLLDKLQLAMPEPDPLCSSIMHSTRQKKRINAGCNNDLNIWPVHERGFVQYGTIA